ncbi:MAG: hypothetical protein JSU92_02495 [Deltaproteobacteria bacterium]|nr:MAG: hypothetical protein JSU92_02495 [Deltaproteobacteria bacterium]
MGNVGIFDTLIPAIESIDVGDEIIPALRDALDALDAGLPGIIDALSGGIGGLPFFP